MALALRVALLFVAVSAAGAHAADAQVAVAANFAGPASRLADQFAKGSAHRVLITSGSTGKFYAQITSGAPFDVLLSADDATPNRLEQQKLAVAGSRFTYAIGRLVLWSARPALVDDRGEILRTGEFRRLAMANPRLAPYGAAARQAMEKLGVWSALQGRLVQGENIAQTLQFVSSGNAELGFVALSQVKEGDKPVKGSYWLVPSSLYEPIMQDAVLLARGEQNAAALAFLEFLRSRAARAVIGAYGYGLP